MDKTCHASTFTSLLPSPASYLSNARARACVHARQSTSSLRSCVLSSAGCLPACLLVDRHATTLSFSLSLINAQINICVCMLFVPARVNQLFYASRLILIWSPVEKAREGEREKECRQQNVDVSSSVFVNICSSQHNNRTFQFLRVRGFRFLAFIASIGRPAQPCLYRYRFT